METFLLELLLLAVSIMNHAELNEDCHMKVEHRGLVVGDPGGVADRWQLSADGCVDCEVRQNCDGVDARPAGVVVPRVAQPVVLAVDAVRSTTSLHGSTFSRTV